MGSSLGIGSLSRTLVYKKMRVKERIKAFSTAKTQAEKLEEEIHYEIELKKAVNRNKASNETINILNSEQKTLNKLSNRYDFHDKNASQTKEESQQKAKELSTLIEEQYDKLDLLTTQKVLHDRFWRIRTPWQKILDYMLASFAGGMVMMVLIDAPVATLLATGSKIITSNPSLVSLAITFTPLIIGGIGTSIYMLKRNRDYKKVFHNLNASLGNNALADKLNKSLENAYEEQKEIEDLLEMQIRDISLVKVQLQEQKRVLDTYLIEDDTENQSLGQSPTNLLKIEKAKENGLNYSERDANYSIKPNIEKFYTEEDFENLIDDGFNESLSKKIKGPTLVKRRKTPHKDK